VLFLVFCILIVVPTTSSYQLQVFELDKIQQRRFTKRSERTDLTERLCETNCFDLILRVLSRTERSKEVGKPKCINKSCLPGRAEGLLILVFRKSKFIEIVFLGFYCLSRQFTSSTNATSQEQTTTDLLKDQSELTLQKKGCVS